MITKIPTNGYMHVTVRKDDTYVNRSVHRLVALAFIPNHDNKPTVNHKDKDRANNNSHNLEWATHSEQILHAQVDGPTVTKAEFCIDQPNEIWKDVKNWPYYKISNHGRIQNKFNKLKKQYVDERGYCYVRVGTKCMTVHSLMAQTFLEKLDDNLVVNHIDGNKSNNNLDNLEVVTQSQNMLHAYANNLVTKKNKVQVVQVDYEGNIVRKFDSYTSVETETGFNRGCIKNALENGVVSHGYKWFASPEAVQKAKEKGTLLHPFFKVFQCKDGELIQIYDSYPQAEEATGVSKTNIHRACTKGYNAGGFRWFHNYLDYKKELENDSMV